MGLINGNPMAVVSCILTYETGKYVIYASFTSHGICTPGKKIGTGTLHIHSACSGWEILR